MNYTNILQWGDDGLYCTTCGTDKYHDICSKCANTGWYYYANAEQINGLIEEAEKGYEWSKANGLWVCNGAENCKHTDCVTHRRPHAWNHGCAKRCESEDSPLESKCIPYRVEPKEDDMNDVPSNDRKLEYRVKKYFAAYTLSSTDIDPDNFKLYYMLYRGAKFEEGDTFIIEPKTEGPTHDIMLELLRLGYIEEVVHDPVIKVGDCFKSDDGILYKIFGWGDDLKMASVNQDYQTVITVKKGENRLSDFIVGEKLKCFTPCKIEIREVEE